MRRRALVLAALTAIALAAVSPAKAEPVLGNLGFAAVPGAISGQSPDGLGTWTVHYQRVDGGNPDIAAAINDHIDAEAYRGVQVATWDGSTRRPWSFDAVGTLQSRPITVAEIFTAEYNTDEPNMPMRTVGSVVCDSRSGVLITWDNLFRDKRAGLTRLSDATVAALSATQPPALIRDWRRMAQFAPLEANFKAWIPTASGIELHFPEFQFGRGLKVVTVPWAKVSDLIAPEFLPIAG